MDEAYSRAREKSARAFLVLERSAWPRAMARHLWEIISMAVVS